MPTPDRGHDTLQTYQNGSHEWPRVESRNSSTMNHASSTIPATFVQRRMNHGRPSESLPPMAAVSIRERAMIKAAKIVAALKMPTSASQ